MDSANRPEPDLTSTVHIPSLRPVHDASLLAYDRLDETSKRVLLELAPTLGMLIAITGPGRGARYLLDGSEITIGRSQESQIFLDDITVSREHAVIRKIDKGYEVEDRGSLNGTYIDGKLTTKALLMDGEELQIGKFRVNFFKGGKR